MTRYGILLAAFVAAAVTVAVAQQTSGPDVPAPKIGKDGSVDTRFQQKHAEFLERAKAGNIGVLFIGDSITEGWLSGANAAIWNQRFGKYNAANFGISGDRTQHVLWRIQNGELDGIDPRVVVLMIGTNNIHATSGDAPEAVAGGVTAIVREIGRRLPRTRVVLLGIFPRGADPADPNVAAVRSKVAAVNATLARLDDGDRVRYLDISQRFLSPDGALTKEIMPDALHLSTRGYGIWADSITPMLEELANLQAVHPEIWPAIKNPIPRNTKLEAEVERLLGRMTLEEKVAQTIQPSIAHIKPEDVRKYHFGSVLNGGGGWPGDVRKATPQQWLNLADAFYEASVDRTDGGAGIPVIWGSDAVHGHNNIVGATLFPHNVGLGATRNPDLLRRIGEVTATEMEVTGIDWNFSPTVAVAQDDRWGRAYESYSEDPEIVRMLAGPMVEGLQGRAGTSGFLGARKVIATTKHFLGDGGTLGGRDQGDTRVTEEQLRDTHGAGYVSGVGAGVQAVMASYNSWHGRKMHGNGELLTNVLKNRMGFDGMVVGDWNGHGQVPGCTNSSCPQSFNAGVDMFMVPEDWKALYENTLAQVKSGAISRERLDDAVRRILRVKMRAGLFASPKPSQRGVGGRFELIGAAEHRAVARQAVRESLVLLKNNDRTLPIRPTARVLVAGDGAHNIAKQSGGWTLTWQGDGNTNADFPGGTSIWSGIRMAIEAGGGIAVLSPDGTFDDKPDVAVVVYGEDPYAEFQGDRKHLVYDRDTDLQMVRRLKSAGIPVVSVFLSGRPLWVNPYLNASDAFVATWLPGTEGNGVADVLVGTADGKPRHDFRGKLSFSWPRLATQVVVNKGDANYNPLFPVGYGLTYSSLIDVPELPVDTTGVNTLRGDLYFTAGEAVQPWTLTRSAREFALRGSETIDLNREANGNLALAADVILRSEPTAPIGMAIGAGELDVTSLVRAIPIGERRSIVVRLRCFGDTGADLGRIDVPVRITSTADLPFDVLEVKLVPPNEMQSVCPR